MERYRNLSGKSAVRAFEIGDDFIAVRFEASGIYRYTYRTAGALHVENMKKLAVAGRGLGGYISKHVRERYE